MKVRTARGRGGRRLCGRGAMTLLLESDPLPLLPSVASAAAFAHQSCGRGRAFKRKKGARESFPARSSGGGGGRGGGLLLEARKQEGTCKG